MIKNKTRLYLILSLFIVSTLNLTASFAAGYQAYQTWNLPEGAIARFGKGFITDIAYSPDGNKLAATCDDGVWIYNAHSGQELALLSGYSSHRSSYRRGLAFSPDGRTLVATYRSRNSPNDGATNLQLWDTTTWQHKMTLTSQEKRIHVAISIAFSPDGRTLATVEDEGLLLLWDTTTWQHKMTLSDVVAEEDRQPYSTFATVAFSPDGHTIASVAENGLKIWDASTGILRNTLTKSLGFTPPHIAFSPDGRFLASSNAPYDSLVLWNTSTWEIEATLASSTGDDSMIVVAFSPDGSTFAAGFGGTFAAGFAGGLLIYDATTWRRVGALRYQKGVESITFSPDSMTLASVHDDGKLEQRDVNTGKLNTSTIIHNFSYLAPFKFSPVDHNIVAAAPQQDLVLWDITTGESTRFVGNGGQLHELAFSPDGNTVAGGGQYGKVVVWDITTKRETIFEDRAQSIIGRIAYSPDGDTLATSDHAGAIQLWDTTTGKIKYEFTEAQLHADIAYSPDGDTLAFPDHSGAIQLRDTTTGELEYKITDARRWKDIYWIYIQFSPDGRYLVIRSASRHTDSVLLWDTATKKVKATFADGFLGFSPDSSTIIIRAHWPRRGIEFWDISTKKRKMEFDQADQWFNATFSPDRSTIATNSQRGLELWDAASGELRTTLSPEPQNRASFSPDGRFLITIHNGSGTGFFLWEVPSLSETLSTDINEDGKVDQNDLLLVATSLGQSPPTNSRVDVNGDGDVTIADLLLVIEDFEGISDAAAPAGQVKLTPIARKTLESLISHLAVENDGSPAHQQVLAFLHSLLTARPPDKTRLLPNYPNPFNPETWVPYHLAEPADVTLHIHSVNGVLVRTLNIGYQPAGVYQRRSRAAYWDGKNEVGEPVASGVYFYTLTAGDFTATRKLLIRK